MVVSEDDIPCPECGKGYQKKNLQGHISAVHRISLSNCEKCGKGFKNPNYLRNHVNKVHNVEEVICEVCSKVCKSRGNLYNHKRDVHEVIENLFCNLCGELQKNYSHLSRHKRRFCTFKPQKSEANSKTKTCDFCDLKFKDNTSLKIHRNVKHTHDQTHVCDHCAAVFYTKYKLDTHLASKHGINDGFKCEECQRFLKSAITLLKHTRKYSATPCPVCGKEFMSKWKLVNHLKGHMDTKTKSHICDECGKDFLHNSTLVEHIEIVHQGKRPFTCTRCDKTFSRAGSLRSHKLIHTGVRPFPCKLCRKECREKVQLIKHLRSKHGIEDNQMHNFVQNEDMKTLLQNFICTKREPIVEEPFDVKPISFKTEPKLKNIQKNKIMKLKPPQTRIVCLKRLHTLLKIYPIFQ